MARNEQSNGETVVDTRSDEEKAFDASLRTVGGRARDIAKAIKDYRNGESELDEVILEVQLGQRKLAKALTAMAAAHKTFTGK